MAFLIAREQLPEMWVCFFFGFNQEVKGWQLVAVAYNSAEHLSM